jgi:hypothetical protein
MNACVVCGTLLAPIDQYGDLDAIMCRDHYFTEDEPADWPLMFECHVRADGVIETRMTDEWRTMDDALDRAFGVE